MSKHSWYVHLEGENIGPLSTEKVSQMLQQNRLQFVDFIWAQHLTKWHRINDLDQFASLMPPYPKVAIPESSGEAAPVAEKPTAKTAAKPATEEPKAAKAPAVEEKKPAAKAPAKEAPKPAAPPAKVWPNIRKTDRIPAQGEKVKLEEYGEYSVVNISIGGIFLKASKLLDLGTEVKFELELPGAEKVLQMTGVVIRHGQAENTAGFAIEFTRINPAHKRTLTEYLTKGSAES